MTAGREAIGRGRATIEHFRRRCHKNYPASWGWRKPHIQRLPRKYEHHGRPTSGGASPDQLQSDWIALLS